MNPNLFHFATSELSQDAFLCWMISWADASHGQNKPYLHHVGKKLLQLIYQRSNMETPDIFSSIEIRKQDGNIDILCIINHKTALLIEDKVGTVQHSDQLSRYKEHVHKILGFNMDSIIPVYIQTGVQSDYREVEKQGYIIIERKDLLTIFESESGIAAKSQSDIFNDYSEYLRTMENDIQSFHSLKPDEWNSFSWIGFYAELQRSLNHGNFGYVPNPSGGFFGFWWNFFYVDNDECELYLQLEEEKFCFKISVDDDSKRRDLRQYWHEQILQICPAHSLKARRPDRFGNGQYMTVAILDEDYRIVDDNGLINMEQTLKVIQSAQSVIDACLSLKNQSA